MVSDARQVGHTAPSNEDDRVFLQVVPFAGDVRDDDLSVGEFDARDLAHGRVRLFGLGGVDLVADALLLVARVQCGGLAEFIFWLTRSAHHLVECCHGRVGDQAEGGGPEREGGVGEGEGGEEVGLGEGTEGAQGRENGQSDLRGGCRGRYCARGGTVSKCSSNQHGRMT
ncbi:hypothetical protein BC937DRAFT_88489 [Endogone sp. FLAS-F59071]|nr:hypothetical protein BC937DRAFT_88489 [Endogone sp. FLAS-F59071]|eukprot:RUS18655.1 hypothetical protein BC937DRAFT_88489 [Endogone sp. FLAS-F59071]